MQRVLVTGANGFVGSALTRRLVRDGIQVRAMCRDIRKAAHLEGAELVQGDIQDAAALDRSLQGCDVVFHVAAAMGNAYTSYNVNVLGSRNVAEAAARSGVERLVHVSTIAVYGYAVEGRIDESHPQQPSRDDFYQQSKSLGESVVWQVAKKTGLPVTCVRPGMVYGPGSTFWSYQLYQLCRRAPLIPLVNGGQGYAHPIYVDDLADLMITLATHTAAVGYSFHATPDPAPTWQTFLGYYARMAGKTATFDLPVAPLLAFGPTLSLLTRLKGNPFDLGGTLRYWGGRVTYSMARAREILGWQACFDLDSGMRLTEPWLKNWH